MFSRMLSLCTLMALLQTAHAPGPTLATALAQKERAFQLFSNDAAVQSAIKHLSDQGYRIVSRDAAAYQFAYGDEGPTTRFLITAWFGKPARDGWHASFVAARVTTDSFDPPAVTLLDSQKLQQCLR